MSPRRIQRKRSKGWRMPEGAVYVGRMTLWGNPFSIKWVADNFDVVDDEDARATAVSFHREWLEQGITVPYPHPGESALLSDRRERVLNEAPRLAGKDLACWCPLEDANGNSVPCHADVLLDIANPVGDIERYGYEQVF